MPSKFGGIPVSTGAPKRSKFGGIAVDAPSNDLTTVDGGSDTAQGERMALTRGQRPRSTAEEAKHQFSYQGREFLNGIGGVAGLVVDPIAAGMEKLGLPHGYRGSELATMAADAMGLDRPETGRERKLGAVQRGLGATATGVGLGRALQSVAQPVVRGVGNLFAGQPGVQAVSAVGGEVAGQTARDYGATPGQQAAATIVGGLSPVAVPSAAKATVRGLMRGGEVGRKGLAEQIDNFAALGATPSVGQATGARRNQGVESLLAGAPTSSGVMTSRAERQAEQIGAGLRAKAESLTKNPSAENAGRAIERGADLFAKNVGAVRKALYWQVDRYIPDTTPVALSNTQAELARLATPTPGAINTTKLLINPRISSAPSHHSAGGIREALEADLAASGGRGLPYSAVKDLRSRIGEALSDFSLTTDKPTAEYKALYSALSRDMEAVAQQAGPDAARAAKRASNYFKASADRLQMVERVIDRNGGPERVYNATMAGTQDGATVLRSVMRSLPKDGQKAVTGAVIKRMGLANPGAQDASGEAFSAATFLTNWNKVSPEAKRALFDVHGPSFAKDMDRVAKVAETIKTGSKVFADPLGTANRLGAYTYGSGLAGSAMTGNFGVTAALLGSGAIANASARLMTNPRFVRWLAHTTVMPVGALPQAVRQLHALGRSEGDDDMISVAESLNSGANELESKPGQ